MSKVGYMAKRIASMDYKGLFKTVGKVHDITGGSRIKIFFDVVSSGLKYQAGYSDYTMFAMYELTPEERNKILTRGKNNQFVASLNDKSYTELFADKSLFNKTFHEYVGRDWLLLDGENFDDFCDFVKKHGKIIVKPTSLCCGKGIEVIDAHNADLKKLYSELIDTDRRLVEQILVQCEHLNQLYPNAVNTLRIVTVTSQSGTVSIVGTYIRIGSGGNVVDNFNHGGIAAPINTQTGIIEHPARDKASRYYTKHPDTNVELLGFAVPRWHELLEFVKGLATVVPQVRYVGWDICIKDDGFAVVEANDYPGNDLYQLPKENIGTCNLIEAALKK